MAFCNTKYRYILTIFILRALLQMMLSILASPTQPARNTQSYHKAQKGTVE